MSDTIFHKIINREIESEIVYEDDLVIAINDISPVANTHILVIPKKTIPMLSESGAEDKELLGHMLLACSKIAEEKSIAKDGYRVVINNGQSAGQTVFQLHMHVLGGRDFSWPPG